MRKSVIVGVLAVGMLLAGCAATEPPEATTTSPSPEPTTKAPQSAPPEAAVPQECIDYVGPAAPGSETLQAAAAKATLPAGVVLNPGMQVIESTDEPGKVEAMARVCSDGITDDELVEVGNAIAAAIYADAAHETVTTLKVSSLVPTGEYLDTDPDVDTISTDFEVFLWDDPRPSNWTR